MFKISEIANKKNIASILFSNHKGNKVENKSHQLSTDVYWRNQNIP